MIRLKDVSIKTQLELIKALIADYKEGNFTQLYLIEPLVKASLLGAEKEQVQTVIDNFVQDCLHEIDKDPSNSNAIFLYAQMLYFGWAGPQDWKTIIDCCERAIQLDHPSAKCLRATLHYRGKGGPVDFKNAITLYEQAIAKGHLDSTCNRAVMHAYGKGGAVDFTTAFTLLKKAIDQDHPNAMHLRASMHLYGEGGPVDYNNAIILYEKAIELVSPEAMCGRAYMYYHELGEEADYKRAINFLRFGIKLGHPGAVYLRATMHYRGKGGPVNYKKAIKLYEQAIDEGNLDAIRYRATMYYRGQGGQVDFENAIILYEKAIKLGDRIAMCFRACMHERGDGGPVDFIKAARLYRCAADKEVKALDALKKSNQAIFEYHYLMHQNQMEKIVDLVLKDVNLLKEFIKFDCAHLLENNKLNVIEDFAEKYTRRSDKTNSDELFFAIITELLKNNRLNDIKSFLEQYRDKSRSNQVCYLILIALKSLELKSLELKSFKKELEYPSHESLELEHYCLKRLDIGSLEEENFISIIDRIINQWYLRSKVWSEESINYTKGVAPILEKILYRVILCGKENEEEFQGLLMNVAIILGKNRYGKQYRIFGEQWDLTVKEILALTLGYGKLTLEASLSKIQNNFENQLKGLTTKLKQLSVQELDDLYQGLRNASEVLFNHLTPYSDEKVVVCAFQKFIQDSEKYADKINKMGHWWLLKLLKEVVKAIAGLFMIVPMIIASLFGKGFKDPKHRRAYVKTFFTAAEDDVGSVFKKEVKQLTEDLKGVIETHLSPSTPTI